MIHQHSVKWESGGVISVGADGIHSRLAPTLQRSKAGGTPKTMLNYLIHLNVCVCSKMHMLHFQQSISVQSWGLEFLFKNGSLYSQDLGPRITWPVIKHSFGRQPRKYNCVQTQIYMQGFINAHVYRISKEKNNFRCNVPFSITKTYSNIARKSPYLKAVARHSTNSGPMLLFLKIWPSWETKDILSELFQDLPTSRNEVCYEPCISPSSLQCWWTFPSSTPGISRERREGRGSGEQSQEKTVKEGRDSREQRV